MKKIITVIVAAIMSLAACFALTGCGATTYKDLTIIEIGGETESFGIAFRKGSDLTRKTEEAIKELIKENKLSELAKKYGVAGVSEYEPSADANESSDDFKKIKDRGTLIIGITDYKPMDYR